MFRAIKWLIVIALIVFIVLWATGYKIGGKTVSDYIKGVVGAKVYDESVKDIRSLVGEAIKAVGEAVSPEVTPEEREELEKVIKDELKKGSEGEPAQKALPPVKPQGGN